MAEEIPTDTPIEQEVIETPQADVVETEPVSDGGRTNLQNLYEALKSDNVFSEYVPKDGFDSFVKAYKDPKDIANLYNALKDDSVFSEYMPPTLMGAVEYFGLGKPSAVPSASVSGGSATKGRGVEQPSMLQPRKASEVEQSVMGYGLPKNIKIGAGKKEEAQEELRLPTEAEFATIEKMPLTKEAKLEEAVRLGTPPVEKATKDITQNKNNLLSTEKELKKVEQELNGYKPQIESLLDIINNETMSLSTSGRNEKNKAIGEYNNLIEYVAPLNERYNELANNYNGYIANEKVLFGDLDKAEKMRQKGLEKEYSHLLNLTQSVGRDLVKTVAGMTRMGFTLNDLIPNFGLITPEQEQAGKKALFEGLEATNKFAEKLITQETPENYKKIFEGDFSLGKLAYITTNAVSSTAPTVAAGLLTGGIGSVAAGAGLGFEESKSIMKDAGLSDEQSDWAAMGLAIPIGLLEKYGADDVVRLLNGSGIRRQVASELAKKIAGKTLSREAIFLEAKKTFGEVIKSKTSKILKEGRNEALTEAAQGELQELTKQVVQEFTGVDKDENMSTQDYVMQQLTQRAEEAAGGFLGGTSMQGFGTAYSAIANKQEFSPSAYTKAMEFADPAKFQQFQNDLMLEVQSGVLTEEQANDAIVNVQAIQETNALIPNSVQNLDLRTEAVNLIIEKNNIAQEIEGKDPDLIAPENARLAEIKKALNEIALGNKPGAEEQQAEGEKKVKTLADDIEVGDTVDLTPQPTTEQAPQTLPEVTNEIANLRQQEQAENEAIDPNDEVAKKEIYDKYDEAITPLLEQAKSIIESNREAELEAVNLARAESERTGEVPVVDGEPVNNKTIDDINAKYDAELDALNKPTTEAQAPVTEEAKGEKEEVSVSKEEESPNPLTGWIKIPPLLARAIERISSKNRQKESKNNAQLDGGQALIEPSIIAENINKLGSKEKITKEEESVDVERYAKENKIWIGDLDLVYEKEYSSGAEAKVYLSDGGKTVTKVIKNASHHKSWNSFLNRIAVYNNIFPETKYEVIGFGNKDGKLSIVLKQPFVSYKRGASIEEIDNDMKNRGFEKLGKGAFINRDTGVYIRDLYYEMFDMKKTNRNVIISKNGEIRYIDPVIKIGNEEESIVEKSLTPKSSESQTAATPTSEQAPQPFPAQEGAESVEDKFQANSELEQIYRELNAAVIKNVDKDTIRMLKENPTEAMVDKALRELQKKGIINIEC